jgi:hypothetical protein
LVNWVLTLLILALAGLERELVAAHIPEGLTGARRIYHLSRKTLAIGLSFFAVFFLVVTYAKTLRDIKYPAGSLYLEEAGEKAGGPAQSGAHGVEKAGGSAQPAALKEVHCILLSRDGDVYSYIDQKLDEMWEISGSQVKGFRPTTGLEGKKDILSDQIEFQNSGR